MADTVESLVLEQLRFMRSEQAALRDDVREIKNRLATLEGGQGTILQHMGHQSSAIAQVQITLDRLGDRVERVERRLDLADAG
jgi:septal ring factor EnvC (AmiA/AmiB activator)